MEQSVDFVLHINTIYLITNMIDAFRQTVLGGYKIAFTFVLEIVYLSVLTTEMQKNRILENMFIVG